MTSPTTPTPTDDYQARLQSYLQDPRQLRDPAAFRRVLLVETDDGPKPLADVADPWQAEDFRALDGGWRRVAGQVFKHDFYQRAWLERPRGHSKTCDVGAMALQNLLISRRPIHGVAGASSRDQAGFLRDGIEKLVKLNPWMGAAIEVQRYRIVNLQTGSDLQILSASVATSWGALPSFVLADELTVWPDRGLWDSLLSSAAKRRDCMLIVISNAGFSKGEGWQWRAREAARKDPRWYFHSLDGPQASWITQDRLDEQKAHLPPLVYARCFGNTWTSGSGDAVSPEEIDRAVKADLAPLAGPEKGFLYVAGLDLGLTKDASALVVVGVDIGYSVEQPGVDRPKPAGPLAALRDLGYIEEPVGVDFAPPDFVEFGGSRRVRLASVHLWQSRGPGQRIAQRPILDILIALDQRFGLALTYVDMFQAAGLLEQLQAAGVTTAQGLQFTAPVHRELAAVTLEAFGESKIDLFDHPELIADLRNLRVVERQYGIRLESPRSDKGEGTPHGDAATALSLALLAARRCVGMGRGSRVDGPLLVWP